MASPPEATDAGGLDGLTLDSAPQQWSPWRLLDNANLYALELRLVLSALAIIYIGAHGALRRPHSAALPAPKRKGDKPRDKKDDHFAEGLTPSDALMFPVLAGIVLVGLYYIIQWLQDPAILNQILRVYMSVMSVASMSKFLADGLDLLTNFVFPNVWRNRAGRLLKVNQKARRHDLLQGASGTEQTSDKETEQSSPLAAWGCLALPLSTKSTGKLWGLRRVLRQEWSARIFVRGMLDETSSISLNSVVGFVLALGVTASYYLSNSAYLANLMGAAFCYGAFMIMSCTDFLTGTLVLVGLFFYDIVMVFYTPYMITVATKIDAPIKLTFEGAAQDNKPAPASLLGLGDIVVPGIVICLALRYDLYRFYQSKIKYEPVELSTTTGPDTNNTVTTTETRHRAVKAPFVDPQGQWGDRWWTSSSWGRHLVRPAPDATAELAATGFPKTYFYASMVGYTLGMLVTLGMLLVFKHGQPALLYLVPGVLGSVWLTALVRRDLKDVWKYTEDGSLDTEDVVVELDENGRVVQQVDNKDKDGKKEEEKKDGETEKEKEKEKDGKASDEKDKKDDNPHVVFFAISAPSSGEGGESSQD